MGLRGFGYLLLCCLLTPALLHAQAPAEVLSYECRFTMKSPTEAVEEVKKSVLINSRSGLSAGLFLVYTDEFRTLSSFSGSVSVGGKTVRKLKKQDVITVLDSDALAERVYANGYEPSAPYPFIVEYEYTVTHRKAIVSFPTFFPVPDYDIPVRSALYVLEVPFSVEVQFRATAMPQVQDVKGGKSYQWFFQDVSAPSRETGMPDLLEFIPYVYASPVRFQYFDTSGSQADWAEVGRWIARIMPRNPTVPKTFRDEVLALTDGCRTDLERIRTIYDYLREHTRYVSIQLGVGGYIPSPPEQVAASGFGDCKALSYYMQQLLSVVGIPSAYTIVNTQRKNLPEGYSSLGQMNHAILCVPAGKDTLWVECTNPKVPLGYRHSSIAGHQGVIVGESGGKPVRIPEYPDSLRSEESRVDLLLAADGSAQVSVARRFRLNRAEPYIGFASVKGTEVQKSLLSGLQGQADSFRLLVFQDNFRDYDGEPGYVPEARVRFSFHASGLAQVNGERLFVKTAPFSKTMSSQKTDRLYDLVVDRGSVVRDSVLVRLPDGYEVEHIPEGQEVSSPLMTFRQTVRCQDNSVLIINELRTISGRLPAERYTEFRELAKAVNKAYESTMILRQSAHSE